MSLFYNSNKFKYAVPQQFFPFGELRRGFLFTPFNKVETITEGANNYKIEYYPNQQKAATTLKHNNTVIEHKLYAGKAFDWEIVNDKKYYYVYAEGQPIAVFIQDGDGSPVPYLILTDHLGSVDLITDRYGNVVDSMSFDAWGNRRNYNNWQQKDNAVHLIDRGFTMHQHLDSFSLINMEGRVYDPVVAQFLSPDPYVQAPDNTQNLNRYTYCLNSPLMYTDPTGEKLKGWQWLLIGLGVDLLTGGILSSSMIATNTAVYTTAGSTLHAASTTMSSTDFLLSFGKAIFDPNSEGQAMDNWWNIGFFSQFSPIVTMFSYDKSASGFEWAMQIGNNLIGGEFLQDQVGSIVGHALNIGNKIEATGFYKGRLISRTTDNTINSGVSFGHFIYGDNIALNPDDVDHDVSLFAHEFAHTYQSRTSGWAYLFKYGISSAAWQDSPEGDADRRAIINLGIDPYPDDPEATNQTQWWEAGFGSITWPLLWIWNK